MTLPSVITESLDGSRLADDALADRLPRPWLPRRSPDPAAWREHVEQVRAGFDGSWLTAVQDALEADGPAADRLGRTEAGRGVVVVTGQQPGLFGGPIYTWSKALSALALADALEAALSIPVAPVFWAATDDADFAEASSTTIAVPGGAEAIRLDHAPPPGTPMATALLGDTSALVTALERGAGSVSHAGILELLSEAYGRNATIGGAFVRLLRSVLGPLGIAVLDADHAAVRRAAHPFLRDALRDARSLAAALHERTTEIEHAGYEPQVREMRHLSLVFARHGGVKRRVPIDESVGLAEAATPGELSPTALLRPILERRLLPSVTYVGGPAEISYFAQVSAVAAALDAAMPAIVPRWSGTIVEPHVQRLLDRYGLEIPDVRDPHAAETRLARAALPSSVRAALEALRVSVDRLFAEFAGAREQEGEALLPDRVIDGHHRGFEQRIARLERRYIAAVKRRAAQMRHDVATARGALFPNGKRQERALNLIPILARHGPLVLERMLAAAQRHAAEQVGGVGVAATGRS